MLGGNVQTWDSKFRKNTEREELDRVTLVVTPHTTSQNALKIVLVLLLISIEIVFIINIAVYTGDAKIFILMTMLISQTCPIQNICDF